MGKILKFEKKLSLPDWLCERNFDSSYKGHENKARFVIELSKLNVKYKTGGPFGAAVFNLKDDSLISAGVNGAVTLNCSAAHAEVMALVLAQEALGTHDMSAGENGRYMLVSSAQPCVMCFGAVLWSGISELLYCAKREDVERIARFDEGPLPENWQHELEKRGIKVHEPLLSNEANEALKYYVKQNGIIY